MVPAVRRVELADHQAMRACHDGTRNGCIRFAQLNHPAMQISRKMTYSAEVRGRERLQYSGMEMRSTAIQTSQHSIRRRAWAQVAIRLNTRMAASGQGAGLSVHAVSRVAPT